MPKHSTGGAVCYVRVSSEEQIKRSAGNVKTQRAKVVDYCEHEGLEVLHVFTDEGESAYTQSAVERPQLQALLDYIHANKKRVTHVVTADLSRLARRVEDQAMLLSRFARAGLTYVSVDEPNASDTSAAGKLATSMIGAVNEFYSASLSERVTYRMQAATKNGRWMHIAPLGYLNAQTNGHKNLVFDPARASIVRDAFNLIADGHRLEDALRIATGLGLRTHRGKTVNKQTFSKMMRNPIYHGEITSGSVTARGTFDPLISKELFDKVQDVLKGRVRKREHNQKTELFPLRGFVVCPKCKSKLTAGNVRGRNGKKIGYYFCWHRGCRAVSVRKEILERDWVILLNMMQPNNSYWKRLADSAASSWTLDAEREKKLRAELDAQRAKHLRAIDAKLSGEISAEDFDLWKSAAAGEVQRLEDAIKGLESKRDLSKRLTNAPAASVGFAERWTKATGLEDRQAFQSALFPSGIFWSHENAFFETGNVSLFQSVEEMLTNLKENGRGEWI